VRIQTHKDRNPAIAGWCFASVFPLLIQSILISTVNRVEKIQIQFYYEEHEGIEDKIQAQKQYRVNHQRLENARKKKSNQRMAADIAIMRRLLFF
jgi:hypothetical protein